MDNEEDLDSSILLLEKKLRSLESKIQLIRDERVNLRRNLYKKQKERIDFLLNNFVCEYGIDASSVIKEYFDRIKSLGASRGGTGHQIWFYDVFHMLSFADKPPRVIPGNVLYLCRPNEKEMQAFHAMGCRFRIEEDQIIKHC
jgi:hypothetical protein